MTIRNLGVGFSLFAMTCLTASPVQAQTSRDSILGTVQQFFDALGTRDVQMARQGMIMDGQYHRVREDAGQTSIQRVTFEEFASTLSSSDVVLLERMWEPTVLHHGPIAMVWTDYDFHRDGNFSHCGVDAFHLVRTDSGWKISSIVFTVEPQGCVPSPLGPPTR